MAYDSRKIAALRERAAEQVEGTSLSDFQKVIEAQAEQNMLRGRREHLAEMVPDEYAPIPVNSFQSEIERQMEENWKLQNNKSIEELRGELRSLQNERDRNTQMWDEAGNYLGENEVLKADYDRKIGEVRNKISSYDHKPKTNARRDKLIERLGELERYSGVVTTTEMADEWNREQRAIREELADIDRELENPERFYDTKSRAPAVVKGSLKQAGSSLANAGATALNAIDELTKQNPELMSYTMAGLTGGPADAVIAAQALEFDKAHTKERENYKNGESKYTLKEDYDKIYDFADRWNEEAAKDLQKAKNGLSPLGQAGIDISTNIIQMGLDAAGKYAGLGMLPFFIRAAGGGSMEARHAAEEVQAQANAERIMSGKPPIEYKRNGEDVWKELAYGLTSGTIELATEKLFDGVAGIFGKGAADDIVESLIGKLSSNNTGRTVLRAFAGAAGEGAEEVISDLLEPFAQRIYNDDALKDFAANGYEWGEILYDFLIGAAVGGMGSVGSIASGENAYKNAMLDIKKMAKMENTVNTVNNAPETTITKESSGDINNLGQELTKTEENNADPANYDPQNTASDETEKYSYEGKTADGIEVYETSDEIKKLPFSERKKRFLSIMENEYRGRTAKFQRDGETLYAKFEDADVRKNIYGDRRSDNSGYAAKINVGAEGDIFELIENSEYNHGSRESGKSTKAHEGVTAWEYYIKTAQIDGRVYDVLANVRKKPEGEYVYSIQLTKNHNKKAAAPLGEPAYGSHGELATLRAEADATTVNSVAQPIDKSKINYEQGEIYNGRDNISDRGQERRNGESSGDQNGAMEKGSVASAKAAEQIRKAVERQNRGRNLQLEKVSSKELGIDKGTDSSLNILMPESSWDDDMRSTAERVRKESGLEVKYVLGAIEHHGNHRARGVILGNSILIQADNSKLSVGQIADHELYHAKKREVSGLNWYAERKIIQDYGKEDFLAIVEKYIEKFRGIIDVPENVDSEEWNAAMNAIKEEIFADAYAGIDFAGSHANKYNDEVNAVVEEHGSVKTKDSEVGIKETRGPPEKYSEEKIDRKKEPSDGAVPSTVAGRGSHINTGFEKNISELKQRVKEKHKASMEDWNKAEKMRFMGLTDKEINELTGLVREGNEWYYPEKKHAEKNSVEDGEYSYEWFVSKPDMKLTEVQEHEGLSRAEIVAEAKKNAAAVGYINSNGVPTVHVTDIDTDIEVPVTAIRHGLDRRLAKQAPVTMQIGEVLQNAIKINELEPRKNSISNSYVLVGAAKGSEGTYITEFVVNRYTNEIEDIDVLYSANTKENVHGYKNKKEPAAFLPESTDESASLTGSTISISELLQLVNRYFPDIMPKNVLAHFEYAERPKGILGESAKYSVEDEAPAPYSEERSKNFRTYMEQKEGKLFTEQEARAERARRARVERDAVLQERDRENIERVKQLKEEAKKRGETKPSIAKNELRQHLNGLFSIPEGKRAEIGQIIDGFSERVMYKGEITEKDRKDFFDRLYEEGVMTVPPESDYADGRKAVKGGHIYVNDSIKADFGADWKAFYRRAFAAGVYLTNDRRAYAVDEWTKELGESLPGLFDSEELDGKIALERIVQVAEEGKDEKMSLADYTAMIADEYHIPESELLDDLERKLDIEIQKFAEKADLEIKLRDKDVWKNAKEKAERREMIERQKERKILSEKQKKLQKELQWLSKNRRIAPEEQKAKIDDILGDLDILAIGAANELQWNKRYKATWGDLAEMYETAKANDPNFLPSDDLEKIYSRINKPKVADLTISELYDMLNAAVGLRHELETRNKELGEERKKQFSQLYKESREEIQEASGGYKTNKFKHFGDRVFNLKQLSAMNVIQRMVGWNPDSAFYKATAQQLEEGERDERAYITKAEKLMGKFLKENEEWVKKADGQGNDAIWYELSVPPLFEYGQGHKPVFGEPIKVYMTPSQKVHLYLESKNYDNLRHIEGGRTFADKELYSQGKRQEAFAQGTTIKLAPETVKRILRDNPLTEEEMKLANVLQQYYNVTAKNEINKVSNILNGYDKAVHENYAPIYTNKNYTNQEFGVFDVSAEGVGNMKGRQKSKNPSYNISCFEAFEKHTEQTARYVGMAIPTRNLTKLLNWQEDGHSMREVIGKKWGDEALKYIDDLITALQSGNRSKGTETGIIEKVESNFISSIFGANPSIVAKQLGSIPVGSVYLGFENLKGIDVRHIDRELIAKYTQELDYRTLGYSTPETKFLKENPNWTETNKVTRFVFGGGAITAMDGWAASVLWPQAENKVKHEHPELEIGTQEMIDAGQSPFYKKVAEEFNEAVARSQSTSDQMHQGEFRKSKNPLTKAFTMFKSDSAQSYNAIRQKAGELGYYKKRLEELKQTDASPNEIAECEENIKKSGTAVGTAVVALLTNATWAQFVTFGAALIKNAAKYYRDDDDELTFESFFGEFMMGVVGDLTGTLVGGEELAELIREAFSGKNLRDWEISTMALEQFNDMCRGIVGGAAKAGSRTSDVWNVLKSGKGIKEKFSNVCEYYKRHGNDILGEVKDLAETAATYFYGVPAKNFEKYLLGLIRPFAPQATEAYNNLFETADKNSLKGLRGKAAETEVKAIIKNRLGSNNKETAKELTRLYCSDFPVAIPTDTPAQFSVNGEYHELNIAQQQKFDRTWKTAIGENLDKLLQSTAYKKAKDETKVKMISCLYDYGQEKAKAEILEEYAVEARTQNADSVIESGLSLAEWAAWYGASSGLKNDSEKIKALANTKFKDKTKLAILGTIKGTATKNESGKLTNYGMVKTAVKSGLKVNEALELMEANTLDDYLKWVDVGMSSKNAVITAEALADLDPDAKEVEKYTEISELPYSEEIKEDALKRIMNESAYEKYMEARQAGISTYDYCEYLRKISNAKSDVDSNGKTIRNSKKKKVLTIIDEMNVSEEQKDVLFLANGYSKNTLREAPWH